MNGNQGSDRPAIVISDRLGQTASPRLTTWVARFFTQLGYTVKINDPYKGGDIVRSHGDPARRQHSLQIELNRSRYMEESTFTKHAGFDSLRGDLAEFAQALRDVVTDPSHPALG